MSTSKKPYKTIEIELEDGRVFKIDAHKVAHDRATHYGNSDEFPSFEVGYKEEYDFTICNSEELYHWLRGNMDWYELDPILVRDEVSRLCNAEVKDRSFHY